jgi:hypothetical protein
MKNIQNIVIAILSLCVIVLFYLTLNKNTSGPQVLLNPSSKTLSNVDFGRVAFINTDTFFERYTKFKNIEKELEAQQKQAQAGLEGQMKQLEKEWEGKEITRPKHWGGFLVRPVEVEFWQGRPNRLHDRIRYQLNNDYNWKIERLSP